MTYRLTFLFQIGSVSQDFLNSLVGKIATDLVVESSATSSNILQIKTNRPMTEAEIAQIPAVLSASLVTVS